jgi:molybdate transport system substrate-binding protein
VSQVHGRKCAATVRLGLLALFICVCSSLAIPVRAGEIKIAAASDLTFAFKDVVAQFEEQTKNRVKVAYGSSGNFFSQIQNGAPFDLFFSADLSFPQKLEAAGLAEPGSIYTYAKGEIVIWVPHTSKLDLKKGLAVLLDPGIGKIAIANPLHAPYGAAAVTAIKHQGIYEQVKSKFVQGENVSQAAQFVLSGNADVGIIALSLALAPAMKKGGRYVVIPPEDYAPLVQAAVVLKSSRDKDLSNQFLKYLRTPQIVSLMSRYGFIALSDDAAQLDGSTVSH